MPETLVRRRLPPWLAGLPLALAPWPAAVRAPTAAPPPTPPVPPARMPCRPGSPRPPARQRGLAPRLARPVRLATGEKFLRDIALPDAVSGDRPSFIRLYRLGSPEDGPLG